MIKYITLIFCLIIQYNLLGQKKFLIQGESKFFNNKTLYVDAIPLSYGLDNSLYPVDTLRSTMFTIKEEKFSFELFVYESPYMMMIYSVSEDPNQAMQSDFMDFFLVEEGNFDMTIFNESVAVTSPLNEVYRELKERLSSIDTTTDLGKENRLRHLENYINENDTSMVALWAAISEYTFSGDETYVLKILDLFGDNIKATTTFRSFKNDVESVRTKTIVSSVSCIFPDIPDTPIDLKNTFSKSNYTLIHFWASWCGPCLKKLPRLIEAFEQIEKKDLQMIGINTSDNYVNYNKILDKHKIKWDNFLDSEKIFEKQLLIRGIPKYYLINQQGVIQYEGSDFDAVLRIVKSGIRKE